MSMIMFERELNHAQALEADREEELDEDAHLTLSEWNVDSSNFIPTIYRNIRIDYNMLANLVKMEKLDTVVVNISRSGLQTILAVKKFEVTQLCHTKLLDPANAKALFDSIDNEELCLILTNYVESIVDDLGKIYFSGCLVVEVRDYRQLARTYHAHMVLLKPSPLSIYCDVNNIVLSSQLKDNSVWTPFSKAYLESRLIHLSSPKLCLDPRPSIGIHTKRLSNMKSLFSNPNFLKMKRLQLKRQKQSLESNLAKFIAKTGKHTTKTITSRFRQTIKQQPNGTDSIASHDVKTAKELASFICKPKKPSCENNDPWSLVKIEVYNLESVDPTIANDNKFAKLSIFWRQFDETYHGNLHHYRPNGHGETLMYEIGNELDKRKYIEQFIDIYTDNGSKPMKIVIEKEGETEHKVQYTYGADIHLRRLGLRKEPLVKIQNPASKSTTPVKSEKFEDSSTSTLSNDPIKIRILSSSSSFFLHAPAAVASTGKEQEITINHQTTPTIASRGNGKSSLSNTPPLASTDGLEYLC